LLMNVESHRGGPAVAPGPGRVLHFGDSVPPPSSPSACRRLPARSARQRGAGVMDAGLPHRHLTTTALRFARGSAGRPFSTAVALCITRLVFVGGRPQGDDPRTATRAVPTDV